MARIFCSVCGGKLQPKTDRCGYCPHCKQDYYDNPKPCADLAIFNDDGEVLLCKRAFDPGKGKWDMSGGFIEYDESADATALREAEEELGVKAMDLTAPKYVMSYSGEYPWGKETYKIVVMVYVVRAKKTLNIKPQDDVADTKWIKPDDIDRSELSDPRFKDFIKQALITLNER